MPRGAYTLADYKAALLALLPNGPVWPREPGAVIPAVMEALAPTYLRNGARAMALLADSPVGDLAERLVDWEDTVGLPDPCIGQLPTLQQRKAAVRGKIAALGGQSAPYFVSLAASFGFAISVTEFKAAVADDMRADDPCNDPAWASAWQVNMPGVVVTEFAADLSAADEPLAAWGSPIIECLFQRYGPAQAVLTFSYSDPAAGALLGDFVLGRDLLS